MMPLNMLNNAKEIALGVYCLPIHTYLSKNFIFIRQLYQESDFIEWSSSCLNVVMDCMFLGGTMTVCFEYKGVCYTLNILKTLKSEISL